MKQAPYPFAAIVGQDQLKTALLLAAVDWRLGVLLRGDKGAGKTTSARALAELLPKPCTFVNLPLGITEDRLLGGLDLGKTLQGHPQLRPGLIAEANGGVLYVDEVNLLPDHLADTLLDVAATGMHTVEREGFSVADESRFVLMGSMNPEEGSLRPQLLDRFALVVDIGAPAIVQERKEVVERRLAYDADTTHFRKTWTEAQTLLRAQIVAARELLTRVELSGNILEYICRVVQRYGVASLRADLAVARATCAHAALSDRISVCEEDVDAVLPLALAHRIQSQRSSSPIAVPPPPQSASDEKKTEDSATQSAGGEKRFAPMAVDSPELHWQPEQGSGQSRRSRNLDAPGPVIGTKRTQQPKELDVRPSILDALVRTGKTELGTEHLHERKRESISGSRYVFVVDSSGSHAANRRMSVVKGAAIGLMEKSLHRCDEVVVISFRGVSADVLVQPTNNTEVVAAALEYLPTGGRTPLAHALDRAKEFVDKRTLLILLTDGRANVSLWTEDPWKDAMFAASQLLCPVLVVDTEITLNATGRAKQLADFIKADCVSLETFGSGFNFASLLAGSNDVRNR